ncbi:MAG: GNAT family acetyltransferase [Pseudomonadota bacterium]|jgi:ribosomal protein S18 acetylase RimI-like enzyme
MAKEIQIIQFEEIYRKELIGLWEACDLVRPWNDPGKDIDRVLADKSGRIFLLLENGRLTGSVMAGFDGHRGWVYYLAVDPGDRQKGRGRRLMDHSEDYLRSIGCPKLNLMIRNSNLGAAGFYSRLGYLRDDVAVMSKKLIRDQD